jgi:diadenosine tetraphosphate (Ap4A) HIT family hydrolase
MCANVGSDETDFGVRILDGRWCDGYLGRVAVRRGYCFVIWKGRHVAEPTELADDELSGFWREVTAVASALEQRYQPMKMNWLSLGNWVPHLHVHLVPRPEADPRAGGPLEREAFDHDHGTPLDEQTLRTEAQALRDALEAYQQQP